MAGPASPTVDEAIRVVVTPSQASYFAGEPFSVTITFTNTRTPEASAPAPRSSSHIHRRGAHSISSVPLARPPTSPGTPRTAVPVFLSPRPNGDATNSSSRKGLIGHNLPTKSSDEPPSSEVLRKRLLASRSLSLTISPDDLPTSNKSKEPTSPANRESLNGHGSISGSSSPRIVAPLARTPALPPNHPHARKQSVLDGQLQLQDLRPPASMSPFAPSPNASMSTFSLSLDPIAEAGSTSPNQPATPYIPSPVPGSDLPNVRTQIPSGPPAPAKTTGHLYPPHEPRGPPRRPSQLGLGHGPPPAVSSTAYLKPPRTAFSSTFPVANTELILYAYAQLLGTLTITPLPDAPSSSDQARNLNRLRARLLKRKAVGGGSMDISSSLSAQPSSPVSPSRRHGRSTSLSNGLLSILSSSSSQPSPQPFVPGHRARTSSVFSLFSTGQALPPPSRSGLGLGLSTSASEDEEMDPDQPLPTLEVQPSMLAVDLSLAPGESRTYTYSLTLPENLPPTFRGRALKFSYQFILGVCRAGGNVPGASPSSSSRVMKVPIRVYNNVAVGRPLAPYNLLWPVVSQRGPIPPGKVIEGSTEQQRRTGLRAIPSSAAKLGTYEDLQGYARNLLASFPDPQAKGVRIKLPLEAIPNGDRDPEREIEGDVNNPSGCRQAVEVLTRNPKKASYDVTKDGVKVAVLTFPKSAYRLGETILGVVELNERYQRARVLKLSAMLEAHESLPSSIASPTLSRHMRRVHAEHHSCFMAATLRTTFSLDIPPDASPAFEAAYEEERLDADLMNPRKPKPKSGGLEWKVRLCLLVAIASPSAREGPDADGARTRHLVQDGPRGQWGSSWKAAQTIAPLERPAAVSPAAASPTTPNANGQPFTPAANTALSWVSYFASSLLGPSNVGYHDGDEDLDETEGDDGDDMGPDEAWREVKVEMVECEVPVRVWPGNTAFKATEVVFDV
ncbi:Rgp1-domain-containing protein [Dichomitus squalens LYAD-421 SS1]|uniref:Rgp1-domain-containing protein n=1 Tax=Dichomitus squalens (strain LYAD-421) TaxID=732165 RepID=R7SR98_DICSQ|nr:Rgp1-domain-containing protein [Dichomitus squalens LYAD-421 SS1]EJF58478.1 Rgp1-domain-containing protein [Dichomitus squalens LYAD-421 SS1]